MSYRIEYQWGAFRVPAADTGLAEDRYVVAVEGGDNNVWSYDNRKRARDWAVNMIGTADQVIRQTLYFAGSCEGGMLQPRGRYCTPEAYVRRIRRLIEGPKFLEPGYDGYWSPEIRAPLTHPVVGNIRDLGLDVREETYFESKRAVAPFAQDRLGDFFGLVYRYAGKDLMPWSFAQVRGLPQS